MPLNLSVNDGDITPYIKYNAKAGRFYVRPQGAQQDVEIERPRLAFDMANILTGWIFYQEGAGPEKVWDPTPSQMAPKPAGPRKFKRGFEVMVFGGDNLPGIGPLGLREFTSSATNVISAILRMYDEYERGAPTNPGAVPFYGCEGVNPVQGAYGTNYEPRFKLIGWVPRAKIPAFDEGRAAPMAQPAVNGHGASASPPGAADYGFAGPAPRRDFDDEIPF